MLTATMTSKGQITIPKEVRETLSLHTGDRVSFVIQGESGVMLKQVTKSVDQVFGLLQKNPSQVRTVEQMNQVITKRMRERGK